MKNVFRFFAGLSVLFCLVSFLNFKPADHDNFAMDFVGEWLLDSVQVYGVTADSIYALITVPVDEVNKLKGHLMKRFTLDADGKASYIKHDGTEQTNVPYTLAYIRENTASLSIEDMPNYITLDAQLISDDVLMIHRFVPTIFKTEDDTDDCKMFFKKINTEGEITK